jgi:hypothetical protein
LPGECNTPKGVQGVNYNLTVSAEHASYWVEIPLVKQPKLGRPGIAKDRPFLFRENGLSGRDFDLLAHWPPTVS